MMMMGVVGLMRMMRRITRMMGMVMRMTRTMGNGMMIMETVSIRMCKWRFWLRKRWETGGDVEAGGRVGAPAASWQPEDLNELEIIPQHQLQWTLTRALHVVVGNSQAVTNNITTS